jgi:hypothetical protein
MFFPPPTNPNRDFVPVYARRVERKGTPASPAKARAIKVLPVPGDPSNKTP